MDIDCIVVGGGAAGLSAALALGRARRRTLVADAGRPSNLAAHAVGGLLGHDGRPPAELYERGRAELAAYPAAEVRDTAVTDVRGVAGGFACTLDDGTAVTAAHVLLAPGMDYRLPAVAGVRERWGGTAFHCPFCHGWEVQDRPLAVLDPGPTGVHRSLLLRAWSDDVVLLTNGPAQADLSAVRAAGIEVDERPVAELRGDGPGLESVGFADGSERPCGGVLVATSLHQRSGIAAQLGVQLRPEGPLFADAIEAAPHGATSVPGVFAAGDAAGVMPSVANAMASGTTAGAGLVGSLVGAV